MITLRSRGDYKKLTAYLQKSALFAKDRTLLESAAQEGVAALAAQTPKDSGKTASSWQYSIKQTSTGASITWTNSNLTSGGVPIILLLQYGHGTAGGTFVQGIDIVNPALKPVFDKISETIWKEATRE